MTPSGASRPGGQDGLEEEEGYFGDRISSVRTPGVVRIAVQNVRGMGKTSSGRKNEEWRILVDDYKLDVLCLNELNIDWRTITDKDRL